MKIVDSYKALKVKYSKYVILIKVGNFYEVYGEEAYILHNLFNYKIRKEKNSIKVGFPLTACAKVTNKLRSFKINFIVVEGENLEKERFNRNNYDNYLSKDLNIEDRIININEKLMILKETPKIEDILSKIEGII